MIQTHSLFTFCIVLPFILSSMNDCSVSYYPSYVILSYSLMLFKTFLYFWTNYRWYHLANTIFCYSCLLKTWEQNWNILRTLHQISMELPRSCKKNLLFMICSTRSGLHLQSLSWWSNIQELVLTSSFWQKWDLFIEHVLASIS